MRQALIHTEVKELAYDQELVSVELKVGPRSLGSTARLLR